MYSDLKQEHSKIRWNFLWRSHRKLAGAKRMLFQSQWQQFKFGSLKEAESFSGFLCSEFSFLLCFSFKEGKKKKNKTTQQCLSGFRPFWEFTANCKVPFAQRCLWNNIAGEPRAQGMAHLSAPSSCSAPPGDTLTAPWRCSAMENLHIDFLVLFGRTSQHQQLFPAPCYSIKNAVYCLYLTESPNSGPEQPKVCRWSRKGAGFV